MAAGTDTYMGLAVPLYGDFTLTGRTAATDTVTIVQPATPTGNTLVVKNSSGTQLYAISKNGNPILRTYTTKPTTGLTKGELYNLFHGSRPYLAVCTSTATSVARMIRLRTKTNGRLTA